MNAAQHKWLIRSSGIVLRTDANTDAARFARLFVETWRMIPLADRRLMRRGHRYPGDLWMGVGLFHDHQRWQRGPSGEAAAQFSVLSDHLELTVRNAWFARLPDEHARCIIAHELGHCVLSATSPYHLGDAFAEEDVAEQLRAWGFDDEARMDFEAGCGLRTGEAA